jgi:hypothetical protein
MEFFTSFLANAAVQSVDIQGSPVKAAGPLHVFEESREIQGTTCRHQLATRLLLPCSSYEETKQSGANVHYAKYSVSDCTVVADRFIAFILISLTIYSNHQLF